MKAQGLSTEGAAGVTRKIMVVPKIDHNTCNNEKRSDAKLNLLVFHSRG